MAIHNDEHPLSGQKIQVKPIQKSGTMPPEETFEFEVEDWWDRITGRSWTVENGNWACLHYAMRSGLSGLPLDDEVIYGKDRQNLGHLIHVSEIVTPQEN